MIIKFVKFEFHNYAVRLRVVKLGAGYNYDVTAIQQCSSTPIRLQFDRATTVRRLTLRPQGCEYLVRAAALRPK